MLRLLLIFTIYLTSYNAHTQANLCVDVFLPNKFLTQLDDQSGLIKLSIADDLNSPKHLSQNQLNQKLFDELNSNYESTLKKAFQDGQFADRSVKKFNELQEIIDAYYFIDLPHLFPTSYNFTQGKTSLKKITSIYGNKAFRNFTQARKFLRVEKPSFSEETMGKLHKTLMKGRIDDLDPKHLGKYREDSLYFKIFDDDAIPEANMAKILQENPYITLYNKRVTSNGVAGEVLYPGLQYINPSLLKKIEKVDPTVAKKVSNFINLNKKIDTLKAKASNNIQIKQKLNDLEDQKNIILAKEGQINKEMTSALVKENIDWFTTQREKIGELSSLKKMREYSDLVAHFHRNMISIHPFRDGNGRTVRDFALYFSFEKEGLIPPKLFYPDGDILLPLKEYQSMVWDGFVSGNRLQKDLVYRLKNNLNLQDSAELTLPAPAKSIQFDKKSTGGKRKLSTKFTNMPPGYFDAFLDVKLSSKSYMQNMQDRFYSNFTGLREDAVKKFKQDNIIYNHTKRGEEFVSLYPVTDDFIETYQRTSYKNAKVYKDKISKYYEPDKVIWRGLSDQSAAPTREQLLSHFKDFNFHFASNKVMNSANRTQKSIMDNAIKDFRRYNQDLFSEDDSLIKMAKDHSETGPLYYESYGYSTSKNRTVGKAFAMGAMVVADYGRHMDFQHLLKGRTLVGQFKSIKDVDLTTLKQVRSKFSYKYGRQQEVMGIGVADPDAVMIVQQLDEHGDVIHTYLRNPNEPHKVIIVSGEASVGDTIPESRIIETVDLNDL